MSIAGRSRRTPRRHPQQPPFATVTFPQVGLRAQLLPEQEPFSLLLTSQVQAGQSMLLVTGPGGPARGFSTFSAMGRWHALYWAVVWGCGRPPADSVAFSSDSLRFRCDALTAAVPLGPAWLAVREGSFSTATVNGREIVELAPQW